MNDNLIYDLYSYAFKHDLPLIVDAADEIKQLRKERDEARILACKGLALEARHTMDKIGPNIWKKTALTPQEMAEERGWDCFKEEADYNNEYFRTHHK
jgi:hypothetical protein